MELEIISKKPIPKLHAAKTSAKHPPYINVSAETVGAIVSTEKTKMLIRSTPNSREEIQWFLKSFLYSHI
tara:strand:- start:63 stop:272 length:210 start_codon:yes stop_codon:yes gene_type:complete